MTRQELYDLVWLKPMTHIAKDFGMSDVAVRKHCKNMDIPTPPVGYWMKLQHNKKVRKPALPTKKLSSEEVVPLVAREVIARSPETVAAEARANEELVELEAACVVPAELPSKIPELVRSMRGLLRKGAVDHHGMIKIGNSYSPNIILGKGSINRLLRIFCALHVVATQRGQKIYIQGNDFLWQVGEETFSFRVKEVQDKTVHEPTAKELKEQERHEERRKRHPDWYTSDRKAYRSWDYVASGRISIAIEDTYSNRWDRTKIEKRWRDRKSSSLEDKLPDIFVWLESASVAAKEKWLKIEQDQREEARRQEIARQRRERRENAESLEKQILNLASIYANMEKVDALAAYMRKQAESTEWPYERLIAEIEGYQHELRSQMKLNEIEEVLNTLGISEVSPLLISALSEVEPSPMYAWQHR